MDGMGLLDRVILTIYTLLLAFLSLVAIAVGLRLIPLPYIWTSVTSAYGRWEMALLAAVFFLVSVRLLLAGVRTQQRHKAALITHTDIGDIHIALDAVESLMAKTARHTRGVRGAKARVTRDEQGLTVTIRAAISPESSVPDVSAQIQQRVRDYARKTVGVELNDVRVLVDAITNEFAGKPKRRVE